MEVSDRTFSAWGAPKRQQTLVLVEYGSPDRKFLKIDLFPFGNGQICDFQKPPQKWPKTRGGDYSGDTRDRSLSVRLETKINIGQNWFEELKRLVLTGE